ncbi:hypothetical protein BKA64DRAFT_687456 [Cadophora sp. MPI-SDFR-AT-0126]|nr:hypothetical protein BKA64DRAFT_687456 [Leotiomycetes sp. MPI-SDFR-AT-0126]
MVRVIFSVLNWYLCLARSAWTWIVALSYNTPLTSPPPPYNSSFEGASSVESNDNTSLTTTCITTTTTTSKDTFLHTTNSATGLLPKPSKPKQPPASGPDVRLHGTVCLPRTVILIHSTLPL